MNLDRAALLVIDVQNDFCPGGTLPVPEGNLVVPVINRVMAAFVSVVATRDWHPPGHVSFASSHPGFKEYDTVKVNGLDQMLWPEHCVQGSAGAALHPELNQKSLRLILHKGMGKEMDSYSAFYENDRKTSTGLAAYLREVGVQDVWLCGLAADICVFYSAMDAMQLGFGVFIIEDGTRGVDQPVGNVLRTMNEMEKAGAAIIRSSDIL
jgi:nicotinamidase/pyrazinamidase